MNSWLHYADDIFLPDVFGEINNSCGV